MTDAGGTERLLTAQELAEQWGVSVYTIYRLTNRKNGLKGCKVGRLTRYRPADAAAYLAAQQIAPQAQARPFPEEERFAYRPGMKVVQAGRTAPEERHG